MLSRPFQFAAVLLAATVLVTGLARQAGACPFCPAVQHSLCDEIGQSDVAVVARLVHVPELAANANFSSLDALQAQFEVVDVLKGATSLGNRPKFAATYFGDSSVGTLVLMMAKVEAPTLNWSIPIVIGERGRQYLVKAMKAAPEGADRLAYFQDYLENQDELLLQDAFDEFANAPFAAVKALKPRMKHDQLLAWIKDTQVPPVRRGLYLTMLGVCGTAEDGQMLGAVLRSKNRAAMARLDALIAAYLNLTGPAGLALVEDLYLKDPRADYSDIYAAVAALRFHGQEETTISRPRLLESLRLLLARKEVADVVIADLARWQDWSVMEQLVTLFHKSDDDSTRVRRPIVEYLRVCPLPQAKTHLDEIARLNPRLMAPAGGIFPRPMDPLAPESFYPQPEKPAGAAEKPATPPAKPAAEAKKSAAAPVNPCFRRANPVSVTYTESLDRPAPLSTSIT